MQRNNPTDQCSVGPLEILDQRPDEVGGIACNRVLSARFDHVAIVKDAAYGKFTGAWPAHAVDQAPGRIQGLAAQWERGKLRSELKAQFNRTVRDAEAIAYGGGKVLAATFPTCR